MTNLPCPFSATVMTEQFGCENASQVTRRDGPNIDCSSDQPQHQCESLFNHLKMIAAPEFNVEDDLLSMPHGVRLKIQFGGLIGLLAVVDGFSTSDKVENISKLVSATHRQFDKLNRLPADNLIQSMKSHQLKRRRG